MNKTNSVRSPAWVLAGLAIVLVSLGVTLSLIYILRTGNVRPLSSHQVLIPFFTVSYALLVAFIASRHPRL